MSSSMPLLRAEGGEEKGQIGLEETEDGGAPAAKAVVLPLPPDEALVVDVSQKTGRWRRDRAGEQRPREDGQCLSLLLERIRGIGTAGTHREARLRVSSADCFKAGVA